MSIKPNKIILSRTDSIGDVILTLPLAGVLKSHFPDCTIVFLGKTYTKPIVSLSKHIDGFLNFDELMQLSESEQIERLKKEQADTIVHVFPKKEVAKLAKKAGIKHRIGTARRSFHLLTCNHRPNFTRKGSDLHEAQLNLKLLAPFGADQIISLEELPNFYGFERIKALPESFERLIDSSKTNVVLHPKSQGSAVEWGLENFKNLIGILPTDRFHVFVTGTEKEGMMVRDHLPFDLPHVTDLTGKMTLDELVGFIGKIDALVAASTGPLHIAAALDRKAIGVFSERRPIHPGRWAPVGKEATALTYPSTETLSAEETDALMQRIEPDRVAAILKTIK